MTPTARSLQYCRKNAMIAGVVERWNPHARIRQDLFGFIDLIVLDGDYIIGVQATSGSGHASRRKKILEAPLAVEWAAGCNRTIEVWSWAKRGPRGKRKLWTLRREQIPFSTLLKGEQNEHKE